MAEQTHTPPTPDSDKLLPCPFCGAGETRIDEKHLSPTMSGPGALVSASVRHWCGKLPGIVASHTEYRGRTREDVVAAWNRRPTPEPSAEARAVTDEMADRARLVVIRQSNLDISRDVMRAALTAALKPDGEQLP